MAMTREEIDVAIREIAEETNIKIEPGFDDPEYQECLDEMVIFCDFETKEDILKWFLKGWMMYGGLL